MTSSEIECVEDLIIHALNLRNFHEVDCMLKHCEVFNCDDKFLKMIIDRTAKYSHLLHHREMFILEVERKFNKK